MFTSTIFTLQLLKPYSYVDNLFSYQYGLLAGVLNILTAKYLLNLFV